MNDSDPIALPGCRNAPLPRGPSLYRDFFAKKHWFFLRSNLV